MLLIGEKILKYRKAANLSQEEFAAKVGVTRQAVSKWELDKAYPDLDKLVDICDILQISVTEFIYGEAALEQEKAGWEETPEISARPARDVRRKKDFARLYVMTILLGGILLFFGIVLVTTLFRYSWVKDMDLTEQVRVERVYQQYTKADLSFYDDTSRRVLKTIWLDTEGIRDGDFLECYTNEGQDGIYYDYHMRTLAFLFALAAFFLLLFLLCCGEIHRFRRENRWYILADQEEETKQL